MLKLALSIIGFRFFKIPSVGFDALIKKIMKQLTNLLMLQENIDIFCIFKLYENGDPNKYSINHNLPSIRVYFFYISIFCLHCNINQTAT
jgi:hypothetical protein